MNSTASWKLRSASMQQQNAHQRPDRMGLPRSAEGDGNSAIVTLSRRSSQTALFRNVIKASLCCLSCEPLVPTQQMTGHKMHERPMMDLLR
eukprot:54248-Eustigmatos_ZCMA.PRE.1